MVAYHTINYTSQYYLAFRYISFLPPSFIFITGYLISAVYLSRYSQQTGAVRARLMVRGVKLLTLFTVLNIVAHLIMRRGHGGERLEVSSFFAHWQDVYVAGTGRFAVFEVLLPIAYLLMIAPLLLGIANSSRALFIATAVILLGTCTQLEQMGFSLGNLNLLSAGVLGMLVGLLPSKALTNLGRHVIIAIMAYGGYVLIGSTIGQQYLVQLFGAMVALAVIFGLCVRCDDSGPIRTHLVRLGQYSLVSYIVQIGILQLLSKFVTRPAPISPGSLFLFSATLILTVLCANIVEWGRNRLPSADRFYKAVFA